MPSKEWVPKLSVRITEKQYHTLQELFQVGHRKAVFGAIIDDIIQMTTTLGGGPKQEAGILLGAIVSGKLRLGVNDETDLLKELSK